MGLLTVGGASIATAAPADAALTCSASVPKDTQAKGSCSGSGTWRLKAACAFEPDKYTSWLKQSSGTSSMYKECTFSVQKASVEIS
ncbi:hypothetical protein [Cellulomonas triticagri]|nr:hypothetical protein [Cellulomonas triticagri]